MKSLRVGVFRGVAGTVAFISGAFWSWTLVEALRLGDLLNLQLVTFFVPEPPGYPPVEKNPLIILWRFSEVYSAMSRLTWVGLVHYLLFAAALALVGVGIYGLYDLEPLGVCKASLVTGFLSGSIILLFSFGGLTGLSQAAVNIGLLMYHSAETGTPFGSNIGMLAASPTVFCSVALMVALIVFGLSLSSARWATADPDRARSTAILLVVSGVLYIMVAFTPYLYLVPSLLLSIAFPLLAHLFHTTGYYT